MSLKDRLKNKKSESTKKHNFIPSEKQNENNETLMNAQEKICSLLHRKIFTTPKWGDYNSKKQEGFIADFVKEQLKKDFPSLKLSENDVLWLIKNIILTTKDFGILETLLKDDEVNYVMVNGADSIYVEKNNKLLKANISFKSTSDLKRLIDNIAHSIGLSINEKNPVLDAYHKRGYHINILIPPAVSKEPCITIKKINSKLCSLEDLLKEKSISLEMIKLFETAVLSKTNILVVGLKESGKTTLLNGLCKKIPQTERVVLIENIEELNIEQKNFIRLKTQPLNDIKDVYQITPLNLIKNSIRMRPDRLILGECTEDEAYEFIKSMGLGYLGLMTTFYANSPLDSLNRLEGIILNNSRLPVSTIREELLDSIGLIIQVHKMPDGERKIIKVSQPIKEEDDTMSVQDIFVWQKQIEDKGIVWEHVSTGVIPKFLAHAKEKGFEVNNIIFDKKYTHTYPKD